MPLNSVIKKVVDFILVYKPPAVKHFCALNFGFILKSCYVFGILEKNQIKRLMIKMTQFVMIFSKRELGINMMHML